jgi:hypothetical protein
MACFTVPLAAAAASSIASRSLGHRKTLKNAAKKISWLSKMLTGGSFLLAIEHVWHGEITWRFPFLTAVAEGPEATEEMMHEIATRGVAMLVLVTAVWACMVFVSSVIEARKVSANV